MSSNKYFNQLNYPVFHNLLPELISMLNLELINWESNQICLNSIENEPDNFHLGTGSLVKDWNSLTTAHGVLGAKLSLNKKTQKFHEHDFNTLCSVFHGTEFEKVYNFIKERHNIGRTRIMKLEPKAVYSWHKDTTPRIHYVIKTNYGSGMVVENEHARLNQSCWYWVDTTKHHTAYNAAFEPRIHLVFTCV